MRAIFVAVGSELLGTERLDTNSLRVAETLERFGVELGRKLVVGDDDALLAAEIGRACSEAELVVVSGGLGPTTDDLTRQAVARAFDLTLTEDPEIVADIEAKYQSFGRTMPAVNRRQAMVPDGAEVLWNPRGTAPGLRLRAERATLFLLPGVPRELVGLVRDELEPWLEAHTSGDGIERSVLKVAGVPESELEELIAPAYDEHGADAITVLSSPGEIRIELRARGDAADRRAALDLMTSRVRGLIGFPVFTEEASDTLEATVGRLLLERNLTLATAESCTGGLVSQRVTSVPGSSAWFVGGAVAYSNELKTALVGVDAGTIERHGAVSEPVARQLAEGARTRLGADVGVGVTGIAGPDGGTDDKPVGTVWFGLAGPADESATFTILFPGNRERIRRYASQFALEAVRRRLLGHPLPTGFGLSGAA